MQTATISNNFVAAAPPNTNAFTWRPVSRNFFNSVGEQVPHHPARRGAATNTWKGVSVFNQTKGVRFHQTGQPTPQFTNKTLAKAQSEKNQISFNINQNDNQREFGFWLSVMCQDSPVFYLAPTPLEVLLGEDEESTQGVPHLSESLIFPLPYPCVTGLHFSNSDSEAASQGLNSGYFRQFRQAVQGLEPQTYLPQ